MYINNTKLNTKITRNCLPTYKNIKTREHCQWKFSENVLTLLPAHTLPSNSAPNTSNTQQTSR
jgi:hypothetical protein